MIRTLIIFVLLVSRALSLCSQPGFEIVGGLAGGVIKEYDNNIVMKSDRRMSIHLGALGEFRMADKTAFKIAHRHRQSSR